MGFSTHHHLHTIIAMKVIYNYVLTNEFQTARQLYPVFTKAMEEHSKLEPMLGHNFKLTLDKMCCDGMAESSTIQEYNRWGSKCVNETKIWRRK